MKKFGTGICGRQSALPAHRFRLSSARSYASSDSSFSWVDSLRLVE